MKLSGTAVVLTMLAVMFIVSDCFAQKPTKSRVKHDTFVVSGVIKLVKDKDGQVSGITMTTQDGTAYRVTTNDAAKILNDKDGQTVDLSGYVEEMDGQKWFTVAPEKKKKKGSERRKQE